MAKRILTPETLNSSLWLRWPDRELIDNFKERPTMQNFLFFDTSDVIFSCMPLHNLSDVNITANVLKITKDELTLITEDIQKIIFNLLKKYHKGFYILPDDD